MGNDPAVLFYTGDFLAGSYLFSYEQRGKYITLLCLQHQKGKLTEKDMLNICGTYDEDIFSKFVKDEDGLFYNARMEEETQKRRKYSESRSNNRKKKKTEDVTGDVNDTSKTYVSHMENENRNRNRNENSNEIDNEILDVDTSSHCPYKAILDLFNNICTSFPKIRIIDGKRKEAVQARWKTYGSLDVFKELFERAEASRFLKGENDSNWHADFDWMMRPTNMAKILEGKYDRMQTRPSGNVFLDILREGGEI